MVKNIKKRKAQKRHICIACGYSIEPGKEYIAVTVLYEDINQHAILKYHSECYEDRNFAEDEAIKGETREDEIENERTQWDRKFQ